MADLRLRRSRCGVLKIFAGLMFYSLKSNTFAAAAGISRDTTPSAQNVYTTIQNPLSEQNEELFYAMVGIVSGAVLLVLCIGIYCWWNIELYPTVSFRNISFSSRV